MMEEVVARPSAEYIPSLPAKVKQRTGSSTFTQITSEPNTHSYDMKLDNSMHSLVLNSPSATVFVAGTRDTADGADARRPPDSGRHVVTIRVNTDTEKPIAPKISSVHLKSEFDVFNITKKSLVKINVDEEDAIKPPFIFCNSYNQSNMVMSSGQCSPSDTLDSGTCSDLDGTPPPLPKKKSSKSTKKAVTVTLISPTNSNHSEIDFEDNDSNISCDSLNSSELNGSHTDEGHDDTDKKKIKAPSPPVAPDMPAITIEKDGGFLPQGLLQDIRDRSAKLSAVETESGAKNDSPASDEEVSLNANLTKESAQLTSYRLVSQFNNDKSNAALSTNFIKTPLITEGTYEDRMIEKLNQQKMCYSSNYYDTDKYYDFHLNEKHFEECAPTSVSLSEKVDCDETDSVEFFAGVKDYKNEETPTTIKSSKGTIRGVKNRVRAGIATFLQINNASKSYKEKDGGKVVLYTTTMGIVRDTYQRCVVVKKILRNLLVKYEERDVFMSTEYQDEIRDRMRSENILIPQLFVDGQHVGDAETVEKLNESGELRKMLKSYKSPDACTTCQVCGGFRLLPCRICRGSKKSLHRNHFTAEFVALKCMNCDEVGLVRCDAC